MPDFLITSATMPRFGVRVGACTLEHARTVFEQLLVDPNVPSDLTMTEDGVEPEPEPRSRFDRFLRR